MPRKFDFDGYLQNCHRLTPAQRDAVVRRVIREAKAARDEAIRDLFRAASRPIHNAIVSAWRRYRRRRAERIAAARLNEMDDRMLKDIGVRRGEIEFAVTGQQDPTRIPRAATKPDPLAVLRPQPDQAAQPRDLPLVLRKSCAG